MRDPRFSSTVVAAALDAGLALLNGGTLIVYSDPRPATVNEPIPAGAQELVRFTLANPAFAAADGNTAKGAAIASPATAAGPGQGQARWFRAYSVDQQAAAGGRVDNDGSGDLVLSKYDIFKGDSVSVVDWTVVLNR